MNNLFIEYTHPDDYNPPDAEWIDITTIGSEFRTELDLQERSHKRQRKLGTLDPWKKM